MTNQIPAQEHLSEGVDNEALISAAEALLKHRLTETAVKEDGSIERRISTQRVSPFSPVEVTSTSHEGKNSYELTEWDATGLDNEVFTWSNASGEPVGTFTTNGSRETSRQMGPTDYETVLHKIEAASELFAHAKPSLKQRVSRGIGSVVGRKAS